MLAGHQFVVSVTSRKMGTYPWLRGVNYRLGSAYDNGAWGVYRVALPNSIAPNQEATFNFTVTAPATNGAYNFQWRIVQDYVEWFGDYSTNVAVTVANAPVLNYVLPDLQGSVRAVMNNNGVGTSTVIARHDYLRSGEEIGANLGMRTGA